MMRINLLPTRAARRQVELRRQLQIAVVVVLAASACSVWGYMAQHDDLAAHRQELASIQAAVKGLQAVGQEVQKFEMKQALLHKKVVALEELKTTQRRPARLLADLSRSLPDQMWLVSIKETSAGLQISGRSFDNVGIAAFMENLARAPSFGDVALVESRSELLQGQPVVAFTVIARVRAAPPAAS